MKQVRYSIYKPGGNDTALVYGTDYTQAEKKKINDFIMKKHINVEQVGFLSDLEKKELQMAGGEFCGNATRCAAYYFLNKKKGNIEIIVNSKDVITAGIDGNNKTWCEIPLCSDENFIIEKEEGIYIVKIKGIVLVVIKDFKIQEYLNNKSDLKNISKQIINKYDLKNNSAVGVIFCENKNESIKIKPVVWVKDIDTLFIETACGSGSVAVCMVEVFLKKESKVIDIIQPSNLIITAKVNYVQGKISKAIISGDVENDGQIYCIN